MLSLDLDEETESLDGDDNSGGFYQDQRDTRLRGLKYFYDSSVWSDAQKDWVGCAVSTEGRIALDLHQNETKSLDGITDEDDTTDVDEDEGDDE